MEFKSLNEAIEEGITGIMFNCYFPDEVHYTGWNQDGQEISFFIKTK